MPQSAMDWFGVIGVIAAVIAVVIAYKQWKGAGPKTINRISTGNRNKQQGGPGPTENLVEGGDDNSQKG